MKNTRTNIGIVGAGISGLAAAALLAVRGCKVTIFERNWIPGGCATSYPRKGYIFESGATTLVGVDAGMPVHLLQQLTGLQLNWRTLDLPMVVVLPDGRSVYRYPESEAWIREAERVFGPAGQRAFWTTCFALAQKVWDASGRYRAFPPASIGDMFRLARNVRPGDLPLLPASYRTIADELRRHGLDRNSEFVRFVDQQLLISAQNTSAEVSLPFGAAALCYTLFTNVYLDGGMATLANALVNLIQAHDGTLHLRTAVEHISRTNSGYTLHTKDSGHPFPAIIFALPLNNVVEMVRFPLPQSVQRKILPSRALWSAFTMGIAVRTQSQPASLHWQIHSPEPLPFIGAQSVFVSWSHENDRLRAPEGVRVLSVSTHIPDPEHTRVEDKTVLEAAILDLLFRRGVLVPEDEILYQHSSSAPAWIKWTGRSFGAVGGYPQQSGILPWQMPGVHLDGKGAFFCGDTAYPGQGIPGVTLSGIMAAEAVMQGWAN